MPQPKTPSPDPPAVKTEDAELLYMPQPKTPTPDSPAAKTVTNDEDMFYLPPPPALCLKA